MHCHVKGSITLLSNMAHRGCEAEKTWKNMRGYKLIPKVIQGDFCKDENSLRKLHKLEDFALF